MMKKHRFMIVLLALMAISAGCANYKEVPGGNVAKKKTEDGFTSALYEAGSVDLYAWRQSKVSMVCLEVSENSQQVSAEILCQDQMNLPYVATARFAVRKSGGEWNEDAINTLFRLSPDKVLDEGEARVTQITSGNWYRIYGQGAFQATSKEVLSHYETMEIGMVRMVQPVGPDGVAIPDAEPIEIGVPRDELNANLMRALNDSLEGTPIVCTFAAYTNFDYPDEVTDAIKRAKQREIEIQEEQMEQQKRLVEANNQESIAQINYRIAVLDALKVADANRIIGDSVTLGYLWYQQTQVFGEAAKGPNNWGIVPYTAFESVAGSDMANTVLMSERLGERISPESTEEIHPIGQRIMNNRPEVELRDSDQ
jgi:hypothetical protein